LLEQKRILSIDYGIKRVGLAITDPLRIFAYPLTTIQNDNHFWNNLNKILDEYEIELILLGYPLKEDGSKSSSTKLVENFKIELEKRYNYSITLCDERYSSDIARQRILGAVASKKKRRDKSLVDKNAAAIILEDYMRENV
jgi:putative Holliday junction resolvase